MDNTPSDVIELANGVVSSFRNGTPPETLLPLLTRLRNVNQSILQNGDDKFEFLLPKDEHGATMMQVTVKSADRSSRPQFSVLQLQVLMWMTYTRISWFCKQQKPPFDSWKASLPMLKAQMGFIVRHGGCCNIEYRDLHIEWDGAWGIYVSRATLREFVLLLMQQRCCPCIERTDKNVLTFTSDTNGILSVLSEMESQNPFDPIPYCRRPHKRSLLFSDRLSDVTFICPDGTNYHAHQLILSEASPYFETYFTGPWAQQSEDRRWKTEVKSSILKLVLTLIYTGSFGVSIAGMDIETVCVLLQVGQEFQMQHLVEICSKIARMKLDLENIQYVACIAATISPTMQGPTCLWTACVSFISENSSDLLIHRSDFGRLATDNPDVWKKLQEELPPQRKRLRDAGC